MRHIRQSVFAKPGFGAAVPLLLLLGAGLGAAEAKPGDPVAPAPAAPATAPVPAATAPAAAATPAATARQPDPTAAIVAEGRYLYRQRDLDALVLVAARHAKARFSKTEEDHLRVALTTALLAREPFLDAMASLPGSFSGPERDALILDLLDYQAEAAKAPAAAPGAQGEPPAPGATPPTAAKPGEGSGRSDPAAPVLIRLPELRLNRTLAGLGKRQLTLTIALFFRDPALAQKLQARAPLVQDAILGYVQAMPPAQFVEPNQLTLKDGITAAIIAKLPDFPPDAVLIPGLEASAGDAAETPAKAAP